MMAGRGMGEGVDGGGVVNDAGGGGGGWRNWR